MLDLDLEVLNSDERMLCDPPPFRFLRKMVNLGLTVLTSLVTGILMFPSKYVSKSSKSALDNSKESKSTRISPFSKLQILRIYKLCHGSFVKHIIVSNRLQFFNVLL